MIATSSSPARACRDARPKPVDRRRNRLVVDLVQVFDGQAARDAAFADGMARDKPRYAATVGRTAR